MSLAETHTDKQLIRQDRGNGIIELTLNRPKAFNALSSDLMTELSAALSECADNPQDRVIILAGSGPGFCAGHDLKEVRDLPDLIARERLMAQCSDLMMQVVYSPKPIIAKVQGVATAAGCQLVASCDLAVADNNARFGTPGVNIGLFCHTPMVALSRNVSRKHAMEMLLTGEMIGAEDALRFGLINRHAAAAELDASALDFAEKIASKSAYTVRIGKQAFYKQLDSDLRGAYDYASKVMVENMMAHDAKEGIGAFIEKRQPKWQDR
jgi:enoyl-CoA hydratase/carnithine racemase